MSGQQDNLAQNLDEDKSGSPQPDAIRQSTLMPEDDDPDMIDLREAEKAIAEANNAGSEDGEDGAEKPPAQEPATQTAAPIASTEQQPTVEKQQIMIPKARLDEVLRERDEYAGKANYFRGIAEARGEMVKQPSGAPSNETATPTKTVQDVLDDISNAKIGLAEKYEAGEITAVEWKKQEVGLDRIERDMQSKLQAAEIERVQQQAKIEAQHAVQSDNLNRQAAELEAKHPYTRLLRDDQMAVLSKIASDQLRAQKIDPKADMFKFRETLAALTDQYGPIMTGKEITQDNSASAKGSAQQNTAAGVKPTLSPMAQARQNKSRIAEQQPPNTNVLGSGGGTRPEITEADIMKMSDDELAALPPSIQSKFVGAAGR